MSGHVPPRRDARGHHVEGTRVRIVANVLVGVVLGTAICALAVWLIFPRSRLPFAAPEAMSKASLSRLAATQHWTAPPRYRQKAEAAMAAHLDGYGWVDASHDRARIPIARAMEILARGGRQVPAPAAGEGTP